MNKSQLSPVRRYLTCAAAIALLLLSAPVTWAQVWQRQAFGQGPFYYCGHEGDPLYAFNYPNNNNWSQELVQDVNKDTGCVTTVAPSNWSTATFPGHAPGGGDNAVVGNGGGAGTNLDRGARTAGRNELVLNNLTITPEGILNMEYGAIVIANFYNLQTNKDANAFLSVGGGGGFAPKIVIPAQGTMKKTIGLSTFQISGEARIEAINGATIACDAGALQLPGGQSYYYGPSQPVLAPIHFDAATGALIDLAPQGGGAIDPRVLVGGYITGINTGGTVRLNKGVLTTHSSIGTSGGVLWNFGGDTFQWQGGNIDTNSDNLFTNAGTINITAPGPFLSGNGFINQGKMIQSSTGSLGLLNNSVTANTASGTYEFRNDNGFGNAGAGGSLPLFNNSGLMWKSAGTGRLLIPQDVQLQNIGGTIRVDSGTLAFAQGLTARQGSGNGGTFVVSPGATLELSDATGNAYYNGTYTASGGGTILFAQNNIYPDDLTQSPGFAFNFPAGMCIWSGGTMNTQAGSGFTNLGAIAIKGPVGNYGGKFTNQGTITITGNNGAFGSQRDAVSNGSTGVWDIQNDSGLSCENPFSNAGTFTKSSGGGTSVVTCGYINSGSVSVRTGTLGFQGDYFNPSNSTHSSYYQTDGVLDLDGGNVSSTGDIVIAGGKIIGSGTINGNVRNTGGVLSPGHSPGKITITGNYSQAGGAALNIEIGGTTAGVEYDQLIINGSAQLDGVLNMNFINGYRPKVGDTFTFIAPASTSGSFATVLVNGAAGNVSYANGAVTLTVTQVPDILLNISTRLAVLPGDKALIGGFIVTGTEPKRVIIRGLGPSLSVPGPLADPTLDLYDGANKLIYSNDNWKDAQQAEIQATGIPPTKDAEAAMVQTLAPGAYTAVLRGKGATTGIGLLESYDLSQAAKSKAANISTRGFGDTGDNLLIGGFIVGGGGGGGDTAKVIVRAIGPSLAKAGVSGVMQDPTLELKDANGSSLGTNDNWKDTQQAEIQATDIPPSDDLESAIVRSLPPGAYTAIVRGKNNGTGIGLVEVYNLQ